MNCVLVKSPATVINSLSFYEDGLFMWSFYEDEEGKGKGKTHPSACHETSDFAETPRAGMSIVGAKHAHPTP